jgi:hypothetical protein
MRRMGRVANVSWQCWCTCIRGAVLGSLGQMPTVVIGPTILGKFTITGATTEASLGDGLPRAYGFEQLPTSQERRKAWLCAAMEKGRRVFEHRESLSTELECLLHWRLLLGVLRYGLTKVGVP